MGGLITFPDQGGEMLDYLAAPPGAHGRGVVVSEYRRSVPRVTDTCDRIAREGLVTLAPDLDHGRVTTVGARAGR